MRARRHSLGSLVALAVIAVLAGGLLLGPGLSRGATPVFSRSILPFTIYPNSVCLDNANRDACLVRDGANALAQRSGTSNQSFAIYGTFTDASNYERVRFIHDGSNATILQEKAGTGLARGLVFGTGGTSWWQIDSNGNFTGAAGIDNSKDIGSSSLRARSGYFGTSVISPLIQGESDNSGDIGASGTRWRTGYIGTSLVIGAVPSGFDGGVRLHVAGMLHVSTSWAMAPHIVSVANNASGGVANIEILSGLRSLYFVDCDDLDGCTIQFGTTVVNAQVMPGAMTQVFSIATSGYAVNLADVAGVQHVGATTALGINDNATLTMVKNRSGASIWVETAVSNN